jgi:hypothetical protein
MMGIQERGSPSNRHKTPLQKMKRTLLCWVMKQGLIFVMLKRKGQTIHQKVPIEEREWWFEWKKFERKVTVMVSMTTQMMQEGERKREKGREGERNLKVERFSTFWRESAV